MSSRLRSLVLAAALLIMPLQGVAATLSPLHCDGDRQAFASVGQGAGAHQNGNLDDGSTSGNSAFHPCHNTVAAAPVVTMPGPAPDVPIRTFAPDALYSLFIPEQPQRPPLI